MFRLLKLGVGMIALAAFAWFGVTYKLGSQTLFQHLRAIGQTKESQDLVEGTRQAASPLVDDVRKKISGTSSGTSADKPGAREGGPEGAPPRLSPDAGAPLERLSSSEQRQLRKLLSRVER